MPGAAAGMNGYLNTRGTELQLYGYWLSDRLLSPSADLKHTHRSCKWTVTVLSSIEMWQIILKKSCDLTDWVMVSLSLKMVSCLSAEVKHDMNNQWGEDFITFGRGDVSLEFAFPHVCIFSGFCHSPKLQIILIWHLVCVYTCVMGMCQWIGFKADWLTESRCFLCFSFSISIKRYKRNFKSVLVINAVGFIGVSRPAITIWPEQQRWMDCCLDHALPKVICFSSRP